MSNFAEKLAYLRELSGLTQKKLGEILKVVPQTIQSWEYGISFPTSDKLLKIANYFDVSVDYLIGNTKYSGMFAKNYQELSKDKDFIFLTNIYNNLSKTYRECVLAYVSRLATEMGIIDIHKNI